MEVGGKTEQRHRCVVVDEVALHSNSTRERMSCEKEQEKAREGVGQGQKVARCR